jgi:predicted nucleotidyltransferase component of viral defense system
MTGPSTAEWEGIARRFGAEIEQVHRDHLISHVLAVISAAISTDDLVFFGGTALSRTHLTDARLSEDIDLVALAPRRQMATHLQTAVRRGLARSYGRPSWRPDLASTSGSQPAVLSVQDGATVQVQLIGAAGFAWPTEVRDIEQRYSDAPPARLRVLTAAGFAAAKLAAWIERGTPRDLYDLWAMSERGLIDPAALDTFIAYGPTGRPPSPWMFDHEPDEPSWRRALGHQTVLKVTARDAIAIVHQAWAEASR